MSSLLCFSRIKNHCFELYMRNGVNCLSTLIRSVVGCLTVVFTCFTKKYASGVFCIRDIHIRQSLHNFFMSSSLEILQEKKMGVFCHREIIITVYCFKSINRFSTAGCFVIGIYLNWVISYYLIVQSRFSKGHFDLGYSGTGLFYTC
jgi:hypothetical protein